VESKNVRRYGSIKIASLENRRRGKHHDLVRGIMRELKDLRPGLALEIPLSQVGGVELANLRSAVHRAAGTQNLTVETQSDTENLYVWLSPKSTRGEQSQRP